MIKSDKFPVLLPENFFYKFILLLIPGLEIIFYHAAGIAGVGIEAPERVI